MAPYWSCTETRPALLAERWTHVVAEHTVPAVGRFDVALLSEQGKLLAALEVFHKGPVSATKLRRLHRRALRWAEVRGNEQLHQWHLPQLLPTVRSPFKV